MNRHQVIARQIKGLENMLTAALMEECAVITTKEVIDKLSWMKRLNDALHKGEKDESNK